MSALNSTRILWITAAWRTLEMRSPVKLCTITSERHYRGMSDFMNELLDEVGDDRRHPLTGLLDAVTSFVQDYENEHLENPKPPPFEVLKLLMQQHGVHLIDIVELFDSPAQAADVVAGLCPITARQARALAKRFGVPASMFL